MMPSLLQLFVLCPLAVLLHAGKTARPNQLLVIAIDGLRWDYPSKLPMSNLLLLAAKGVRGLRLKNVFPTATYPNHWTIVTGKTPENHGIVANSFYDPSYDKTFTMKSQEEMWWNTTIPIWATAAQQNRSVSTCACPGTEAAINGYTPKHVMRHNITASPENMVDTALGWLQGNETDMVATFFPEPDTTAHKTGFESNATLEKIAQLDAHLGYLWKRVNELGLRDRLNIVLLADHGFTDINASRVIRLTNWINMSDIIFGVAGAVVNLVPKAGNEQKIYDALKNAHPNMTVYRRNEIPSRFMYKENNRIAPIVAMADEGWFIALNESVTMVGFHGYDNELESMKSTFVALGPDFKVGVNVTEVLSLDVYPLLCHLLGITPESHDGNFSRVSCMLKAFPVCPVSSSMSLLTIYNRWLMAAVATVMIACRWSDRADNW